MAQAQPATNGKKKAKAVAKPLAKGSVTRKGDTIIIRGVKSINLRGDDSRGNKKFLPWLLGL